MRKSISRGRRDYRVGFLPQLARVWGATCRALSRRLRLWKNQLLRKSGEKVLGTKCQGSGVIKKSLCSVFISEHWSSDQNKAENRGSMAPCRGTAVRDQKSY